MTAHPHVAPAELIFEPGIETRACLQPGARHADLSFAEAASQRARAAAVTMANNACRTGVILHCPPIAWAGERRVQLIADKRLDELTHPFAQTAVSIGSNQLSKRSTAVSAVGCEESAFMVWFVMA